MLTSRRMLLLGCPVILIIIGFTTWSFLESTAQNKNSQARAEAVRAVDTVLLRASGHLNNFFDSRQQAREATLEKLALQSRQVAGEAAALIIPSLRQLHREELSKKQDQPSGFSAFLSAVGMTSREYSTLDRPISYQDAISENRQSFKTLIPDAGGMLTILNADGKILWQMKKLKEGSQLAPIARREIPFTRSGISATWIFEVALSADIVPTEPSVGELASFLEKEMIANGNMPKNLVLTAIGSDGEELFTVPTNQHFPERLLQSSFNSWQELPEPDAEGRTREAYSSIRRVRLEPVAHLAAQTLNNLTDVTTVFTTEFEQRAYVFLGPAALLILISVTFVWTLRRPALRRSRVSSLSGLSNVEPGTQLLRHDESQGGGRGAPVLFSELPPGENFPLGEIPQSVFPPPDRQSNILRLRELYRSQDGGLLNLNSERVHSPILRELLTRVGNGSLPKNKEK